MPAADAFRREGRRHPDEHGGRDQEEAAAGGAYVYPGAGHGFDCDERASFNKDAAALAWSRTQEFLGKHMKK